ncbi:MAG: CBS domain-containing protein, partial [Betaproteobacteria bacterium]|nr:CBS domain-containing protein [Betaproteobacteria bacterium]
MKTVQQLLMDQPLALWTIAPEASVLDALKQLSDAGIGALLVMENDKLVGILSERDYARKVVLAGKSSKDTPVREIMTANVLCVKPETTNEECMALMSQKNIRHLPVVSGKEVIGMLSMRDLVADILEEREFT